MFWSIVSLVALYLVVRLVTHCISAFWAWLGRGSEVRRARDDERCDPAVLEALAEIERYHLLGEMRDERGKRCRLTRDELAHVARAHALIRDDFLDNLHFGWFQVVMLFFLGSLMGLMLEEVWMLVTMGLTQSRVGLVWGPFSPLYGLGALLLTLLSFELRRKGTRLWLVFLLSALLGGALEQLTGWAMETFMGAISWDYVAGAIPGAITKWVAVPFLVFWGLLGLVWYRLVMPELLFRIGEGTTRRKAVFVSLLGIYLAADVFMTLACFERRSERDRGIPAQNAFESWVDERFSNEFMSNRFQNMVFESGEVEGASQDVEAAQAGNQIVTPT